MFERCDADTRRVLDAALEESRGRGHGWLGTEHLLLALAKHRDVLPGEVGRLLPDAEDVASALAVTMGGPRRQDADLLKTVGVDLDQVRSAVRQTFGDEAIEKLRRPVHQPWQPWRRPFRRCTSLLAGSMSVAPRVKQSLERARQGAERRQLSAIDPIALLLGMVEVEDAMSNALLRDLGVDPEDLRRALGGDVA